LRTNGEGVTIFSTTAHSVGAFDGVNNAAIGFAGVFSWGGCLD
jgi:hypothetical protein